MSHLPSHNTIRAEVNGESKIYCNSGCGLLHNPSLKNPRPVFSMPKARTPRKKASK